MVGMWTRFSDYLSAVIANWQSWVAVAFFAERAVERFFPTIWGRAEPYLTPQRRRRLFVGIAIIAFVWANFRAFDAERSRNPILAAQLRYTSLASGDMRDGKPDGMKLLFVNGGTLPSVGLIFEHKFEEFEHQLTDAEKRSEIAKIKQVADKKRDTLTDSEIQPTIPFSLPANDRDNILYVKKEGKDLTYYLFAVLEYKDRMLPPDEFWITEVCLEMPQHSSTVNCPTGNKIYRSN
jgi:hypothetical protein